MQKPKIDFKKHLEIVKSSQTEGDLHSNWFQLLASEYFDPAGEIQHERRGPQGVVDINIVKNGRCRIAIELKKPELDTPLSASFIQAHRYAFSHNYYKNGEIVYPLGILTNGKQAIVFDGASERGIAKSGSICINLEKEEGFATLKEIFNRVSKGLLGHEIQRKPFKDNRTTGILDETLIREFYDVYSRLKANLNDKIKSFDYWVQLFLVAVLRDNGIIPNALLKALESKGDAPGITKELNRMLNENFEPIDSSDNNLVWEIYGETTRFCTRLNLLHADTLGFAYENLIRRAAERNESYTSVYTPEDLASELIEKLKPNRKDIILDSAAGTGTLLCVAAELAWRDFKRTKENLAALKSFFEKQIFAIDRDIYALKCCKGMLLSTYVKILDEEPSQMGRDWALPRLKEMHNIDLFRAKVSNEITLVVGNPPWGNIHAPDNAVQLEDSIKIGFKETDKSIYNDDTDVGIYVTKRMLDGRMFKLANGFRMGLLLKQQIVTNKSHQKFREWCESKGAKIIDHGDINRFPHSPASKVAEFFFGAVEWSYPKSIYQNYSIEVENEGVAIENFIIPAKGFEPGDKDTYVAIAKRVEGRLKRAWVRKLYPSKKDLASIVWDTREAEEILFVPRGVEFPESIAVTEEENIALRNRSQVAESFPLSWRGCEKIKYYGSNLKCPRIFMPRMPSSKEERIAAGIDMNGEGIGTSGQSIWLKKKNVTDEFFLCIAGWVNSKSFLAQLTGAGVSLRASGFSFDPNEVLKLKVPARIFTHELLFQVRECLAKGYTTDDDLMLLDVLCSPTPRRKFTSLLTENSLEDLLKVTAQEIEIELKKQHEKKSATKKKATKKKATKKKATKKKATKKKATKKKATKKKATKKKAI